MVIGKPILVGKPDTFIAALYKEVANTSLATISGWDYIADGRASVADNVVTLASGGKYKITSWRYQKHQTIGTGTLSALIMHNSQLVTSGDVITANDGDTIRVRARVTSSDPRDPASFMFSVLIEQYEEN